MNPILEQNLTPFHLPTPYPNLCLYALDPYGIETYHDDLANYILS